MELSIFNARLVGFWTYRGNYGHIYEMDRFVDVWDEPFQTFRSFQICKDFKQIFPKNFEKFEIKTF